MAVRVLARFVAIVRGRDESSVGGPRARGRLEPVRRRTRLLFFAAIALSGCAGLLGVEDVTYTSADGGLPDATTGADGGLSDATTSADGGPLGDASASDGAPPSDASDGAPSPQRVYLLGGGRGGADIVDTVQSALLLADGGLGPWEVTSPKLPSARILVQAANAGGTLVSLFGYTPGGNGLPREPLVLSGPQWSTEPPSATSHYRHATAVIGDTIYMFGGYAGGPSSALLTTYRVAGGTFTATDLGTPAAPLWGHAMAAGDGALFAVGGTITVGGSEQVAVTNTIFLPLAPDGGVASAFQQGPPMLTHRLGARLEYLNGRLYALGGFDDTDKPVGTIEVSTVAPQTHVPGPWTATTQSLQTPRGDFCTFVHGDRIYVIGGATGRDGGALSDVFYFPVSSSGVLGNPVQTTPLANGGLAAMGCALL
jgi:hypothetical protein